MSLASLHTICLQRIYGLLIDGMWKLCVTNPFSELPVEDVNELMEMTLLNPYHSPKIGDVILLLTSGRLTRLDLRPFRPKREQDLIVKIRQIKSVSSVKNIASEPLELLEFDLVRNIISWNPYLEEFHSSIHPGFDIFMNCHNLRILKIYSGMPMPFPFNLLVRSNLFFLSSLRNLEVLHLFKMDAGTIAKALDLFPKLISIGRIDSLGSMKRAWRIHQKRRKNSLLNLNIGSRPQLLIANVLNSFPKLISIGRHDSLDSMESTRGIHQERPKNSLLTLNFRSHFQLRRCVWGKDSRHENVSERHVYESNFCDYMRFAVALCPLVKELVFYACVKEAIKELKFLKQLSLLRIDFQGCEGDFVSDFVALLQDIGSQLKHLSIRWKRKTGVSKERNEGIPVDVICDCCPHLESLEMEQVEFKPIFSSRISKSLPLKRLRLDSLYEEDYESLLFLLSNCTSLEEMFLVNVNYFNDDLLRQIFQSNPFTELKVVFVESCRLFRRGYQMFLEKAASVETILVCNAYIENYFYDACRSFEDPNLHHLTPAYTHVKFKGFFHRRLNEKRF